MSGDQVPGIEGSVHVDPVAQRHVAVALIGRGLEQQPGDPWGVAELVAGALGLTPTVTQNPYRGRGPKWLQS